MIMPGCRDIRIAFRWERGQLEFVKQVQINSLVAFILFAFSLLLINHPVVLVRVPSHKSRSRTQEYGGPASRQGHLQL